MIKETKDKERFEKLRGYYDKAGYHSQGGKAVSFEQLYASLGFDSEIDFWGWYDSVSNKEELEDEWQCSGDCCQSILKQLLKIREL